MCVREIPLHCRITISENKLHFDLWVSNGAECWKRTIGDRLFCFLLRLLCVLILDQIKPIRLQLWFCAVAWHPPQLISVRLGYLFWFRAIWTGNRSATNSIAIIHHFCPMQLIYQIKWPEAINYLIESDAEITSNFKLVRLAVCLLFVFTRYLRLNVISSQCYDILEFVQCVQCISHRKSAFIVNHMLLCCLLSLRPICVGIYVTNEPLIWMLLLIEAALCCNWFVLFSQCHVLELNLLFDFPLITPLLI